MKSIALVALLGLASIANAQLINGNFEAPGSGFRSVGNGQTWGNWTCSGPNDIEFVRAEQNANLFNLQFSAYEGEYWIDLCGVGAASGIFQNVQNLSAGSVYNISFAQAGNVWGANFNFSMSVLWNGQVVGTFSSIHGGSNGANMGWQIRDVQVTAIAGANRLEFRANNATAARGAAIDDVRMTLIPAPSAASLLAFGGLASLRRKR
jgi:hypothetical protein